MQQQQEYLINWRNEEFKTLSKLKESQEELLTQMGTIQGMHTKSESQIQDIYTSLVLLQDQTQVVMAKYNGLIQWHVTQMQDQLTQLVTRQEYELEKVVGTVIQGLQAIDRNIDDMVKIQHEALESWSNTRVNHIPNMKLVFSFPFLLTCCILECTRRIFRILERLNAFHS